MMALRRTAATAEAFGLECELISPQRAAELYPIMDVSDLVGAIWLPGDGRANPTDLTAALARGARMRGATIRERTRVTGIAVAERCPRRGRSVTGVRTDEGDVEAEIVINCAGQWAKQVGAMCGVTVPLHSAEHFYVVTDQIAGRAPGPARAPRPGRLHLHQGRGRAGCWSAASSRTPSRGWRPTSCPTRSSSSCSPRTGTTSRS